MHWKSDSRRFTSTTCPTPDHSATIVANAPTRAVTSSVRAMGGSSGPPSGSPLSGREPGHRLGDGGEAGPAGVGPVLPEAR